LLFVFLLINKSFIKKKDEPCVQIEFDREKSPQRDLTGKITSHAGTMNSQYRMRKLEKREKIEAKWVKRWKKTL